MNYGHCFKFLYNYDWPCEVVLGIVNCDSFELLSIVNSFASWHSQPVPNCYDPPSWWRDARWRIRAAFTHDTNMACIENMPQAYLYEPEYSDSELEREHNDDVVMEEGDEIPKERVGNTNWWVRLPIKLVKDWRECRWRRCAYYDLW